MHLMKIRDAESFGRSGWESEGVTETYGEDGETRKDVEPGDP